VHVVVVLSTGEFHYVLLAPWGFAAVTTARFETAISGFADDIPSASYQTTVTCSVLLCNFDPFPYDSENDY